MQIARRVYLYLVTFISLQLVLSGAANLLRLLAELVLGTTRNTLLFTSDYRREQFSLWGAVLLVGAPVWAIHWYLAQRGVAAARPEAAQERRSVLRKLLIYAVLGVALWQVLFAFANLVRAFLLAFSAVGDRVLRDTAGGAVATLLAYGAGWAYYWWVRNADNAVAPETQGAATVRRWYFYLANYATLSVTMWATAQLARHVWELLTTQSTAVLSDNFTVPQRFASDAGWLLAGAALWSWHWLFVQREVTHAADEQQSALRKVYLYGVILQTVAVTLTNLALFGYKLLQLLLGGNTRAGIGADQSLLTAAGGPLLTAAVYGAFWAYHREALNHDARLVAEQPRQASIRRLYSYLVATVGLAVLAGGAADLLRLLVDFWLGGRATIALTRPGWADQISLFITLILVGAPVWASEWLRIQWLALAPAGEAERQSLIRRIMLLLVLFSTVIALLASAAVLFYQLLRNVGTALSGSAISDLSWALGVSITASALLVYHLRVLVDDQRARPAPPVVTPAPATGAATMLLLIQGDAAALTAAVTAAQDALPAGSLIEPFTGENVTVAELRQWLDARSAPAPAPAMPNTAAAQPAHA
jgi:hypothetical protein